MTANLARDVGACHSCLPGTAPLSCPTCAGTGTRLQYEAGHLVPTVPRHPRHPLTAGGMPAPEWEIPDPYRDARACLSGVGFVTHDWAVHSAPESGPGRGRTTELRRSARTATGLLARKLATHDQVGIAGTMTWVVAAPETGWPVLRVRGGCPPLPAWLLTAPEGTRVVVCLTVSTYPDTPWTRRPGQWEGWS